MAQFVRIFAKSCSHCSFSQIRGDEMHMPSEPSLSAPVLECPLGDVYRVVLPPPDPSGLESGVLPYLPGFRDFLTSWVVVTEKWSLVVDVGPSSTIPFLLESLSEIGVASRCNKGKDLFVLLTHVHIDHSGGLGDFISAFPNAKIEVHPRGRPHLIDPSGLWRGSVETLGDLARAYGPIRGVPEESILKASPDEIQSESCGPRDLPEEVRIIATPGHSSHHQSYLVHMGKERILFLGEAAGIYLGEKGNFCGSERDGRGSESPYLRPATPPRFFYDIYLESLKSLAQFEPSFMCYGHFGYTDDSGVLLGEEKQLGLWKDIIWDEVSRISRSEASCLRDQGQLDLNSDSVVDRILERLLSEDPQLEGFCSLPQDISLREAYFLRNSIKGFVGHIKSAVQKGKV